MVRALVARIALAATLAAVAVVAAPAPHTAAQVPGEAFTCDGQFYGMQNGRELFRIDFSTAPFTYTPIGSPAPYGFNGISLRLQDGFLYGVVREPDQPELDNQIVRFDALGNPTLLGRPEGLPTDVGYLAGAFLRDGRFAIGARSGPIAIVDVTTTPPTLDNLVADTSSSRAMADFAVSPIDGRIYGWNPVVQQMAIIDPFTGALEHFGGPAANVVESHGSAWFDAFGTFYFYAPEPGSSTVQDTFYRVDVGTNGSGPGIPEVASSGPPTGASDGASCPFGVRMSKTVEPGTVAAGSQATYRFVITNQSEATITTTFVDSVDAGRTYVAESLTNPLGGTANAYGGAANLTIEGLTLPPRSTGEVTIGVQVPADSPSTTLFNQAELRGLPGFLPPVIPSDWPGAPGPFDPTPLVVEGVADIAITKTGPSDAEWNEVVTYSLAITNLGPETAENVVVTDVLPPEWDLVSASDGGTVGPADTVTWQLGSIAPGSGRSVQVTARAPQADGIGTDTATVTSTRPDPNPANNTSTVTTAVTSADLAITKECPSAASPGAAVVQHVHVSNAGTRSATDPVVLDTLGPGLTFVPGSATANGTPVTPTVEADTPAPGQTTLTFALDTVAQGATTTIEYEATVPATADVAGDRTFTNTATVTTASLDTDPTNNASGPCATTVSYRPQLDVDLVPCPAERVVPGGYLGATIVVTNIGSAPAADTTLAVGVAPATIVTADGATIDANTATWTIGTLGVPGSGTEQAARSLLALTTGQNGTAITIDVEATATLADVAQTSVSVPVSNAGAAARGEAWAADVRVLGIPILHRVGAAVAAAPGRPPTATGIRTRLQVPLVLDAELVPAEVGAAVGDEATATAQSTLANIRVLGGAISIGAARAVARSDAGPFDRSTDSAGSALADVRVNGRPLATVAPNTTIEVRMPLLPWLVLARGVLLEEVLTPTGIAVNVLRLTIVSGLGVLPAGAEITIGHAGVTAAYPSGLPCGIATTSAVSGRATVARVDAALLGSPLARVWAGDAKLAPLGGADEETVAVDLPGLVTTATGTASTSGAITPAPEATSTTTVEDLNLLGGLITARLLETRATSHADGKSAATDLQAEFVDLVVAGQPITSDVKPGTRITVPMGGEVVEVILNDQRTSTTARDTEGEVAAIRVRVQVAGLVQTDIAVAVAHSDAHWRPLTG